MGVDPAEGNPRSDESAAQVLDAQTGAQVAMVVGRVEPATFAATCFEVAAWYNGAGLLIERNNHGHVLLAAAAEHPTGGRSTGWTASRAGSTTPRASGCSMRMRPN